MELTEAQVHAFDEDGYLVFPGLFSRCEIDFVTAEVPTLLAGTDQGMYRELDDAAAVRLLFDCHRHNEVFERLSRHPRLVGPARQLLREDVYIHQSRLNPKMDFSGASWPWHQDYGVWARDDRMLAPRALMVAVFLDEANAANSPLLIVPGSQSFGMVESVSRAEGSPDTYSVMAIDRSTLTGLVAVGGIVPLVGPPGTVAFLHCNIVHGSGNNITPWRRAIFYLNYNAVSNGCTNSSRPEYLSNRDFSPIRALPDGCLAQLAGVRPSVLDGGGRRT